MKVELKLQPGLEEPKVVIVAGEETAQLKQLIAHLSKLDLAPIPALDGERTVLLQREDILRFYADGKGVCAQTAKGVYTVRLRLYELEARLDGHTFVRISNSEIINLKQITALDLKLSGTIRITLEGGVTTYASRRYVKKIKEALGLGKGGAP
ncbi:MAG: LytTR family transcriptional regulator [Oscillibacter sp.]|nr:LytTR family transcriptional regulator [Oscillibacter sp.]